MFRFLSFVLIPLTVISCQQSQEKKAEKFTPSFDWLLGDWKRTNDEEGKQTFEHWEKKNDSTYFSHGYTIANNDTVWQEWATLSPIGLDWYFQVIAKGDSASTNFLLTEMTENSFICQNPENEFPTEIKYQKSGDELYAEISAGETAIPFIFVRKK